MGMGIGINAGKPDEGFLKGVQEAVACYAWFTSTGEVMPKMLKYRNEQGEIRTISQLQVQSVSRKNYCGIPTLVFACETVQEGIRFTFSLIYYVERQEWKLLRKKQTTTVVY